VVVVDGGIAADEKPKNKQISISCILENTSRGQLWFKMMVTVLIT
jgi:hypothetical protein